MAAAEALGFVGLHYDARKSQPGDLAKALPRVGRSVLRLFGWLVRGRAEGVGWQLLGSGEAV